MESNHEMNDSKNSGSPSGNENPFQDIREFIVRNITLDGNTFTGSPSVPRQPLMAQLGLGLAMHYKMVNLSYAQVVRSRFITNKPERVGYGSIHVGVNF